MKTPVLEFCYKSDELGDPMINDYHIQAIELATKEEMARITELAFAVNDFMVPFFAKMNIDLVDFKLEFGRFDGKIILADEISPDTCRFWDKTTKERLDKDRFRRDLGNVEGAYAEMLHRVLGEKA
jgi:phosphoribosylaminoimidazole-succinocarboxamide synthase